MKTPSLISIIKYCTVLCICVQVYGKFCGQVQEVRGQSLEGLQVSDSDIERYHHLLSTCTDYVRLHLYIVLYRSSVFTLTSANSILYCTMYKYSLCKYLSVL